jgi:hypothetical protein
LKDDHLQVGTSTILKAVSAKSFVLGEDGPVVDFEAEPSGQVIRMRLANEIDGGEYYERVPRANPSRTDLEAMTGAYASDEAEVTLKVALEQNGLVIHRRPDAVIPLTPTYRDGFSSSMGSVRFIRDSGGRVIEMSIGGSRMWDLRLPRIQPVNHPDR